MSNLESETFNFENDGNASQGRRLIENCKKMTRIGGIRGESGADFLLPDYMGDIKRLLKSCADVSVANKFIGNGEVSFLILVTYRVMYLDGEERLTEAVFTSDYECNQKTPLGFIDADIKPQLQGLAVRLQGPRKICAKINILSEINMSEEEVISEIGDMSYAECKTRKINIHGAEFLKLREREYAEEIGRIDGIGADEVEIIKCDASVTVDSCQANGDELNVSGNIDAFCLLRTEDDIIRLEKRIPFEDSIAYSCEDRSCAFSASGCVESVSANVNTAVGDESEAGMLYTSVVMNMTLECSAICNYNEEHSVVCDAFVKGKKNECAYKSFNYDELVTAPFEKKKISVSEKREDTPIRNILDSDLKIKNCKYMIANSDLIINGEFEYNIIAGTMEPGECTSIKGEKSFEEKIKLPETVNNTEKVKLNINAKPCEVYPTFDGENIYITFSLCVDGSICESKSEKILTKLETSDREDNGGRRVIVYYPEPGDTLWSVAKKYATSIFDIEKYNSTISDFSSDDQDACVANAGKIVIVVN